MAEQESVYLWSTTALTNGSSDPAINYAEGQLPGTLNNSSRAVMTAIARYVKDTDGSLTTAGSANAYTLTINGRQTPLATGHRLSFKASFSNTSTATLAVTNADAVALGTKAIRGSGDIALVSGQIVSGGMYEVIYDTAANSAAGAWLLLNPQFIPAASVSSIAGNTGAFTLGVGLTNSTNDIRVSLSTATNSIGGDVALNNTANFFDGPSIAQGTSGTWFVSGTVTFTDPGTASLFSAKLWDGTTLIDTSSVTLSAAGNVGTITLSGFLASPAANLRISVRDHGSTAGSILNAAAGNTKSSTISAIRIA